MKRILLCACALALLAGCKKKQPERTVGLALDVGGRGDQSFNDGALRGLETMAAGLRYTAHRYEPLSDADHAALPPADLHGRALPPPGNPPPLVLPGEAQGDSEPALPLR